MKDFLVRLLLAFAATLVAFALTLPAKAQQADDDPSPSAPRQEQPSAKQAPQHHDAQTPSSSDPQTQDALTFNGRVAEDRGHFVLKDTVTKNRYQLDDQPKAKQFLGKQVKVTGKLDMNTNTIHVESIEPLL